MACSGTSPAGCLLKSWELRMSMAPPELDGGDPKPKEEDAAAAVVDELEAAPNAGPEADEAPYVDEEAPQA